MPLDTLPLNTMLLINPRSGKGLSKAALGTITTQLCCGGHIVTIYYANEAEPETLAYTYAKNHDMAICVGGDGTLSSFISGIVRSGASVPIGYIPIGTANDVATTLALSKDPSTAVKTIIEGSARPLDIGLFEGRYFTYITAFGAFTGVSYSTPQSAKRALGHFAYILGGLADIPSIKARHTVVEYDGNVIEGDFIFGCAANSTSVAGFVKLDPGQVDLADGLFEVILVRQPIGPADFFRIITSILKKTYDGDNVLMLHAANVAFKFEEDVAWTVDGEDGGRHRETKITNHHEAIRIIV